MFSTRIQFKSSNQGLLCISQDLPILGATPDAKVIDTRCRDPLELAAVKGPELKFRVTPAKACSELILYLELVNDRVTSLIILFPQLPMNFLLNQLT